VPPDPVTSSDAPPTSSRAALIWNPAAEPDPEGPARVCQALASAYELRVHLTTPERDADACAREALREGAGLLIAAGGDGTVSGVAAALLGTKALLGVLPKGTSNSFAAALGIPADEPGALEVLLHGEPRSVDAARANGRVMLLHASVGFHAQMVGETPREEKQRWGVLAYLRRGVKQLTDLHSFALVMETERERTRLRATNVTVANAAPIKSVLAQGPAEVVPDDGRLDITAVRTRGVGHAIATGFHLLHTALRKREASRPNIGVWSARKLKLTTHPPQPVLIDGEAAGSGVLEVECLPRSVRVLCPAPTAADRSASSDPAPPTDERRP
jgi:YegS/Rv2252/BmrU family lipid kinase